VPSTLRVGFAGTPLFAALALEALVDGGFNVPVVLTRPDRPQGRGLKLAAGPVKSMAQARGLTVLSPPSLKTDRDRAEILAIPLDVLVVAAYGLLLSPQVLAWPRYGCINIHASLLPRWRGAAPIQRAVLAGDPQSGVSIMQMDAGLDTGPVIASVPVVVEPRETAGTLLAKIATAGANAIVETLAGLQARGELQAVPQSEAGATYAAKIGRADAVIDWHSDSLSIDRQIRALNPSPGAMTMLKEDGIKIWVAEPARGRLGPPGTIVSAGDRGIIVACGDGALIVRELQRAGGRRMHAAAFVSGNRFDADVQFRAPS
jgi:methionyl-tRNA formyltransferase